MSCSSRPPEFPRDPNSFTAYRPPLFAYLVLDIVLAAIGWGVFAGVVFAIGAAIRFLKGL